MNLNTLGETLAKLRKRSGMTQQALAEKLGFSNKTVSKWETSETMPEIPALIKLADIFGVSVDYLLLGERKSIVFGGTMLVDMLKDIDCYPSIGTLANITNSRRSVGGSVGSTAIDLAKIDPSIPIIAFGCIGEDENGHFITSKMRSFNINVDKITRLPDTFTGYTDVMRLPDYSRIFFSAPGANAVFGPEHIDILDLQCQIFHLGYALLLDRLELPDAKYGTVMASLLHSLQQRGIKTSLDVMYNKQADLKNLLPSLKYTNYLICNETECCSIFNISPLNSDGTLNIFNIKSAMLRAIEAGVADKVIVHAKEACFVLSRDRSFTAVASLDIKSEDIRGRAAPGDAFCAACLYALYAGLNDRDMLEFASGAAAMSLFAENATDGVRDKNEILRFIKEAPRKLIKGINV